MRISVRSVAGRPSSGSRSVRSEAGSACDQVDSVSRPSIERTPVSRTAVTATRDGSEEAPCWAWSDGVKVRTPRTTSKTRLEMVKGETLYGRLKNDGPGKIGPAPDVICGSVRL